MLALNYAMEPMASANQLTGICSGKVVSGRIRTFASMKRNRNNQGSTHLTTVCSLLPPYITGVLNEVATSQ